MMAPARLLAAVALSAFVAVPGSARAQFGTASQCDALAGNLVRNCGFEATPAPGTGVPAVWQVANPVGGGSGTSRAGNDVHSGEQAAYFVQTGGFGVPSGYGAIRQTLATVPGLTYAITFYAAVPNLYAPVGGAPPVAPNALRVLFGGTTLFDQLLTNDAYQLFTATSVATGATTDLTIEAVAGVQFTSVDDVAVAPVPEPSTAALLGAGFACAGAAASRRRRPRAV